MNETLLSDAEVQRYFPDGPDCRKAQLVLIAGRMYKREAEGWRELADVPAASKP